MSSKREQYIEMAVSIGKHVTNYKNNEIIKTDNELFALAIHAIFYVRVDSKISIYRARYFDEIVETSLHD